MFAIIVWTFITSCTNSDSGKECKSVESLDTTKYELPSLNNGRPEQVIEHLAYTVSYNYEWFIPNWVAYELTRQEIFGEEKRRKRFTPDPMAMGVEVHHEEYSNPDYEHGHMAPAADMKWSKQAMKESFYMTNVCPQNPNNNQGDWKDLENLARDWANEYGSVYICCGPIVGDGYSTIGKTLDIVVPQEFFKVFLRRSGSSWYAIGFVMQNKAQSRPLMTYAMSVDDIEKTTGIDFFYQLPDSIEEIVEADFDFADWTVR